MNTKQAKLEYKVLDSGLQDSPDQAARNFEAELSVAIKDGWIYQKGTFNAHARSDGRFFYAALMAKSGGDNV